MKQHLYTAISEAWHRYESWFDVHPKLRLLNYLLDGKPRRWLEGERQKLDPWGNWMHSDFLDDAVLHPELWWGKTERQENRQRLDNYEGANLIMSEVEPEKWVTRESEHIIALDIDFPGRWVPSSSPGKGHLYINKRLPWSKYEALLHALGDAGILHRNYVKHTTARGYTCLRPGFVSKPKGWDAVKASHFGSDFDPDEQTVDTFGIPMPKFDECGQPEGETYGPWKEYKP